MKMKLFFLMVLFLAIGTASFAQATVTTEKKDANTPAVTTDRQKTGDCTHTTMTPKTDCKWVDANNDGKCDSCGLTAEECKEKCKTTTAAPSKGCDPAVCGSNKEGAKSSSCCPSKDGKK
jgi:hypothetical protein